CKREQHRQMWVCSVHAVGDTAGRAGRVSVLAWRLRAGQPPVPARGLTRLTQMTAGAEDRQMTSGLPLRVRGLRKVYEADAAPVRALRGVDLDIDEGEFVAVTGPSGCGKSTLLNLIAGLDVPTAGEIVVAGEPLAGKSEDELTRLRRLHIGFVFQFFNLIDDMTALENVAVAALAPPRPPPPAEAPAPHLL